MNDTLSQAIKLLPVARALIALAQIDAPNYRPASEQARCANCQHFDGSACRRFDFAADVDYTCDDYDDREPMQELRALVEQVHREPVERAGARHNMSDNEMIQRAHDLLVELGAMCGGGIEAKGALVWRHPGHMNQKVHGNRYGGYAATKESLRRLKDDKEARERYKQGARKRGASQKKDEYGRAVHRDEFGEYTSPTKESTKLANKKLDAIDSRQSELSSRRTQLQDKLAKLEYKKGTAVVNRERQAGGLLGGGQDYRSIAPKTREEIKKTKREIEDNEREMSKLTQERQKLFIDFGAELARSKRH